MMRLLIADDHSIFRRGLQDILRRELPDVVFGEAEDADGVLQALGKERWDLLILDISMPGRSGLEVLKIARAKHPHVPVLVLSMHPEDQYGRRVVQAGASGYLNKSSAATELVTAVRRILGGRRYISPTLADQLAIDLQAPRDRVPHHTLSNREFEVMRLVTAGKSNAEIADLLAISDKTVSTYRTRILDKLDLRTIADLVRYALEHHIVD
jgi:two-component system, NarL family, invasion response regulator UvrY